MGHLGQENGSESQGFSRPGSPRRDQANSKPVVVNGREHSADASPPLSYCSAVQSVAHDSEPHATDGVPNKHRSSSSFSSFHDDNYSSTYQHRHESEPVELAPLLRYGSPYEHMGYEDGLSVRIVNDRPEPRCWDHSCNGRLFSTFSNLLRHQREKAGKSKISTCPKCDAQFTRTTALRTHLSHNKCKRGPTTLRTEHRVYAPEKPRSSSVDTSKRKSKLLRRARRESTNLRESSVMTADDVWHSRLAEARENHERELADQWVHINKFHARPWTANTSEESPDPLEDNDVEPIDNLNRIDSHDPTHFATHESDFKVHPSQIPDEHGAFDAGDMLEGFKASPALPLISTFPSYKGNAAASCVPMEVNGSDDGAETIKQEFDE